MKNLNANKGNIKKLVIVLGVGGIVTLTTLTGVMHPEKIQQIPEQVQEIVTGTKPVHKLGLSNEEFVERFDEIYQSREDLQKELKDVYPELKDFMSNYGKYLDQDQILKALPNLKVVSNASFSGDTVAQYTYSDNTIKFSRELKNKAPGEAKKAKLHECFHFLFQQGFLESNRKYKDIGWMLDEGLVSMLNQEYDVYEGRDNYKKASNYVRSICELIGTDKFMEYAGMHDLEGLIKELGKYSSEKEAKELIEDINKAGQYYRTNGTSYDKSAWSKIEKMYEKKNGVSIRNSDDLLMKIYGNEINQCGYKIPGAEFASSAEANKHYFVKDGKNSVIIRETQEEIQLDTGNKPKTR